MKNTILLPIAVFGTLILASCGNENKQTTEGTETKAPEVCTYAYDASQTKLTWTAYKFTERTGVKGTFDTLVIETKAEENSIPALLTGARFTIPVASINTTNPERDKKIQKFFFGNLKATTQLKGKVSDVVGDDKEGSLNFMLTMNEMDLPVSMAYTLSGDTLILSGTMDVNIWNAQGGITALNKECNDLHKGKDGKSTLWPDLTLELRSTLKKTCK
ncbi:MAG: YceI family protein [Bacteroidia bacterium]